jgi:3-hydroxybutyryl-CoA dehydrogenase
VPTEVPPNDSRHLITKFPVTIALIGATPIAEQIAARALRAGLNVIIDDVSDHRLQAISLNLRDVVRAQDSFAPSPQDQPASARSGFSSSAEIPNLLLTQSIESGIRRSDFLIDALPDDLEVKLELFTLFDKFAKPSAIFITTGNIPIDDLAEITFCPDRCVAIRLTVAPGHAEPSFHLIPAKQTSPQTLAICTQLLGKLFSS